MNSRSLNALSAGFLALGILGVLVANAKTGTGGKVRVPAAHRQKLQSPGERVFMANCSRCHALPMSISPRVTGTIIMHMRNRARLSRQDQQFLLEYIAP